MFFNRILPPDRLEDGFDKDYWGLSYRQGLEYILDNDKSDNVRVSARLHLSKYRNPNFHIMTNEEKKRLHFVDKTDNPDYYLTEYRNDTINSKEWDPVHYIIVDNIKIMGIYQPEKVIPE